MSNEPPQCRHCDADMVPQDLTDEHGACARWICEDCTQTFEELEAKVINWAKARRIIPNATPLSQYLKAVSEIGELADALNKLDHTAMQDAIGDTIVCLINLCELSGTSVTECLGLAYAQIKHRRGTLLASGVFIKEEAK